MPQVFKIGSYTMRIIEARSAEVIHKWHNFYGSIEYYC